MFGKILGVFISTLVIASWCECYRFLVVFPFPSRSHVILGDGYVKHLLRAGHEVTYITPDPMKPQENLHQIDVSSNFGAIIGEYLDLKKLINKDIDIMCPTLVTEIMFNATKESVMHENVQKMLYDDKQEFDAVIVEWLYSEVFSGFAYVFNCPYIWSSSMEPHWAVLSLIDESPSPSYTGDQVSSLVPPFSFTDRVSNLFTYFLDELRNWQYYGQDSDLYVTAFGEAAARRGHTLPPLAVARLGAALMLGNSHVSVGQPVRLPQNYIPIAGYHIDDYVKPLTKDLQQLMDNAEHGVIYFSMGSLIKSQSLPKSIKHGLLDIFGQLNQTVLWKFEQELPNLPKNVHVLKWVPQQSVLAHRNCVLFITHGGLLSRTEAVHYGVPIIGVPMFADQFSNIDKAAVKGFAHRVDLDFNFPINLKKAINEVIGNPRYRERVKELSLIYHDRVVPPARELVHWVEHVVRTRGAPHLRSPALLVPWYQKMYLDFATLALVTIFIMARLLKYFWNRYATPITHATKYKRN